MEIFANNSDGAVDYEHNVTVAHHVGKFIESARGRTLTVRAENALLSAAKLARFPACNRPDGRPHKHTSKGMKIYV